MEAQRLSARDVIGCVVYYLLGEWLMAGLHDPRPTTDATGYNSVMFPLLHLKNFCERSCGGGDVQRNYFVEMMCEHHAQIVVCVVAL